MRVCAYACACLCVGRFVEIIEAGVEGSRREQVWFHFDRVRAGGLELQRNDIVTVTCDSARDRSHNDHSHTTKNQKRQEQKRATCSKVVLMQLVARTAALYIEYTTSIFKSLQHGSQAMVVKSIQCPAVWVAINRVGHDKHNVNDTGGQGDAGTTEHRTKLAQIITAMLLLLIKLPQNTVTSLLGIVVTAGFFDCDGILYEGLMRCHQPNTGNNSYPMTVKCER